MYEYSSSSSYLAFDFVWGGGEAYRTYRFGYDRHEVTPQVYMISRDGFDKENVHDFIVEAYYTRRTYLEPTFRVLQIV